ncbi:hypothetical protein ABH925_003719 [Streptacidiphilus sp. EB129]
MRAAGDDPAERLLAVFDKLATVITQPTSGAAAISPPTWP